MKFFYSLPLIVLVFASGCVTKSDINSSFRQVDELWAVEYQKTEDEYRYRVVGCDVPTAMSAMRKTLLNLGMPITERSYTRDIIIAEAEAPTPLSMEEWKIVVKKEAPRVKEVGGWYMRLSNNPRGYMVKVIASFVAQEQNTVVILDYELDNPKYRSMGYIPSRHAPPDAVRFGSVKVWDEFVKHLPDDADAPRKREANEEKVKSFLAQVLKKLRFFSPS